MDSRTICRSPRPSYLVLETFRERYRGKAVEYQQAIRQLREHARAGATYAALFRDAANCYSGSGKHARGVRV